MYPQYIINEIISMKNNDLLLRDKLAQEGLLNDGYNSEMEKIHLYNAKRLQEIIDTYGFPKLTLTDQETIDSIFLIVQHAISSPELIISFYNTIKEMDKNEYNFIHFMYLEDRINFFLGKPQNYGTQFDYDENGEFTVYTLAHSKVEVNKIRRNYNLPTIEEKYNELSKYQPLFLPKEENEKRMKAFRSFIEKSGWNKAKL